MRIRLYGTALLAAVLAAGQAASAAELKTVTQGTRVLGEGKYFTTIHAPILPEGRPVRQCLNDGPCYTVQFRREPATASAPGGYSWTVKLANPRKRMIAVRWSCHRHQQGYDGPTRGYSAPEWRRYSPGRDTRPGVMCAYVKPDFVPEWIEIGLEWTDRRS
jgi:hypothetical protein